MSRILGRLTVTKIGFGGALMSVHPSHDMGALFCRGRGAWGWRDRARLRLCTAVRQSGIGL